jgi:5'-nucleotidase
VPRSVTRLARFDKSQDHLHEDTHRVVQNERSRLKRDGSRHSAAVERWQTATESASTLDKISKTLPRPHSHNLKGTYGVLDCFDGDKKRVGELQDESNASGEQSDEDLLVPHSWVDGTLKDEAQN